MSRTYRKTNPNTMKNPKTQHRSKKNKYSWKVFREEKDHLLVMKDLKQHNSRVGA